MMIVFSTQKSKYRARNEERLDVTIRRNFGDKEVGEWKEMMEKLPGIYLIDEPDKVVQKLEYSGKFTTRNMYMYVTFSGVVDVRMMEIWKAKIPLKVQIFFWMAWYYRIQTARQLKKRNWDGSKFCKYCGKEETLDHLLSQCPIATTP